MSKKLVLGGVVIIMLLSLFSCGGGKHPSELVGVWGTQEGSAYLEIVADGTATELNDFGAFDRTWSASNGEFCLSSEEGVSTCGNYALSGKRLTWEVNALGNTMKVVYTKLSDEEVRQLEELVSGD